MLLETWIDEHARPAVFALAAWLLGIGTALAAVLCHLDLPRTDMLSTGEAAGIKREKLLRCFHH